MKSKQGDLFAAGPEIGAPQLPKPEVDKPSTPKPELPKPEAPKPEVPKPPPLQFQGPVAQALNRATSEAEGKASPAAGRWRAPVDAVDSPEKDARVPQNRVFTVAELTNEIKGVLEGGYPKVLVRGEVTGFRGANASGHLYFGLKDERASINAVMFKGSSRSLKFALKDGQSVIVEGALNVYEPQGRYSIIVNKIEPEGVGAMALAFEQLKQKLLAEGLFGDRRTRPRRELPQLPRRIGVVTSVTGAALRDFLKVLHRRHPHVAVLVADARVQGDGAAADVSRAIRWMSKQTIDVLVVTRGGGSVEDLWAFNEEPIARAIFASPVPVISAIGHEIDHTIADLVADVRAPTPSAAAEMVVPVLAELTLHLQNTLARLRRAIERDVQGRLHDLHSIAGAIEDPRHLLADKRMLLADLESRLEQSQQLFLKDRQVQLRIFHERISRQHPGRQLRARRETIAQLRQRLTQSGHKLPVGPRQHLSALLLRLERQSPVQPVRAAALHVRAQRERLARAATQHANRQRDRLLQLTAHLEALSPLKVLTRGYALVTTAEGAVVRSSSALNDGQQVTMRFADGQADAKVTATRKVKP